MIAGIGSRCGGALWRASAVLGPSILKAPLVPDAQRVLLGAALNSLSIGNAGCAR
jgi:hypothetical protein